MNALLPDSSVEEAVIGALLLDPQAKRLATERITPAHFLNMKCRVIYESMITTDDHTDFTWIIANLKARGKLEGIGLPYLANLARTTCTSASITANLDLLLESETKRRIWHVIERLKLNLDTEAKPDEILNKAKDELFKIRAVASREPRHIAHSIDALVRRIESRSLDFGLGTGFMDLDMMIGGWHRGELSILAARPSIGKSAMAVQFIHAALEYDKRAVMFSLEMNAGSIVMRMLSLITGLPFPSIRFGDLSKKEAGIVSQAADELKLKPFFIDDEANLTPMEIRNRLRTVIETYGHVDLVVVDYLQLMRGTSRTNTREQEVSSISRDLKAIAKEYDTHVLALAQLSRALTARVDKKPQLTDLRDSGGIEQDADLVAFIHRENYAGAGGDGKDGPSELLIRKHRNGECGTINLRFEGRSMCFKPVENKL